MYVDPEVFTPRWASPPGETLNDILIGRGMKRAQLASLIDLDGARFDALLAGELSITVAIARRLAEHIGGTVEFWLVRDAQYWEDRRRVDADRWAATMPTSQMASLGWIRKPSDWKERVVTCLSFFNVRDIGEWKSRYQPILEASHFRSSPTVKQDSMAVLAWLRQGEIRAVGNRFSPWRRDRFEASLPWARSLTRQRDPAVFVPELTSICAEAGVRVVLLRAPRGCPVSGVARFSEDGSPVIVLSARHLADDHFWFTFFHEVGHLLLHDTSEVFFDGDFEFSNALTLPNRERAANTFAENLLFPGGLDQFMGGRQPDARYVIRKARDFGISPGLLVGQLQHRGVIGYNMLNGLKRRYRWNGVSLEMA